MATESEARPTEEETIGDRLAGRRKQLGYTQQRAADEITAASGDNLTRAAYAQWETSATTPDVKRIRAAARVLATSPAYLAFGERSASNSDSSDTMWIQEFGDEAKRSHWAFPRSWIERLAVDNIHVRILLAPYGDANLGFQEGSALLVDTGIRAIHQPAIYVFSIGSQINVAAMAPKASETEIAVKAGSVSYDVSSDAIDVRGRVIGCCGKL